MGDLRKLARMLIDLDCSLCGQPLGDSPRTAMIDGMGTWQIHEACGVLLARKD